uniref:Carboxylic ester hydrolase n=1 Tax=Caenorhabditis tropicalis TaxID=1561998 RepID=A0A1I7TFI4_9PELO
MGGHLSNLKPEPHTVPYLASCGPVRGNVYRHGDKSVDGFLGIPYAKPPIGELRFKKPVLSEVWNETKDCTQYGPRCPSSGMFYENIDLKNQDVPDEENCLTLNVFRPNWQSKEYIKRPVMVFIHGGGFELCASRDYCDNSLSGTLPLKDIVLVTINYRLGALGFFSTGDENCKGNFGLWDQTLALKWVQKHIKSFGGDPNNVTIFGQSAGGASVDLLSLSPHSRDLFHKFIPMSGNAHVPFAIRTSSNQAKVSLEYAKNKGFMGSGIQLIPSILIGVQFIFLGSSELFVFTKSLPTQKLLERTGFEHSSSGMVSFGPNLDGDFFPEPLDKLRHESSKKPTMIGMTEHEGLLFAFTDPNFTTADEILKKRIASEYKEDVMENSDSFHQKVFEYYTNYNSENNEKKLVAYTGDSIFNSGVLLAVESLAQHGNSVYFYVFDYCNPEGFGVLNGILPFKVPTHCTELRYIVGEGVYSKFDPDEQDLKMMEYMTTVFSNFAKYGNPNHVGSMKWEKYEIGHGERHFHITSTENEMREEFHGGRCQFLKQTSKENKSYQNVFFGKNI